MYQCKDCGDDAIVTYSTRNNGKDGIYVMCQSGCIATGFHRFEKGAIQEWNDRNKKVRSNNNESNRIKLSLCKN